MSSEFNKPAASTPKRPYYYYYETRLPAIPAVEKMSIENPRYSVVCARCTKLLSFSRLEPLHKQVWKPTKDPFFPDYKQAEQLTFAEFYCNLTEMSSQDKPCEICLRCVRAYSGDPLDFVQVNWSLRRWKGFLERELWCHMREPKRSYWSDAYLGDITLSIDDSKLAQEMGIPREPDVYKASKNNLALVKEWFKECTYSHIGCTIANEEGVFPSRLLDLGTSEEQEIRLVRTGSEGVGNYACLSYCWGKNMILTLTRDRLPAMSSSISLDAVPLTIRDAIFVTRALGLRYIWVDSLCIIQDSDDDKRTEIIKMAKIYRNAHLTIIAADAWNANDGFLIPRRVPKIDKRVRFYIDDNEAGAVNLRTRDHPSQRPEKGRPDATETRAWCFQESILGSRCLVYSSRHMYWCCQELPYASRDESIKEKSNLENVQHFVEKLPAVFRSSRKEASLTIDDRKELYTFWSSIVAQYSGRRITFVSDRFRALSAMAQEFQSISLDTYMAGHWLQDFSQSMLWETLPSSGGKRSWPHVSLEPRKPKSKPKKSKKFVPEIYVAPSWSWLSISSSDKIALGNALQFVSNFKILDVKVNVKDPVEPFGNVDSGVLRVRGRLSRGLLWVDAYAYLRKELPDGIDIKNLVGKFDTSTGNALGQDILNFVNYPFAGGGYDAPKRDGDDGNDNTNDSNQDDLPKKIFQGWPDVKLDDGKNMREGISWKNYTWGEEARVWALEVTRESDGESDITKGLVLLEIVDDGVFQRVGVFEKPIDKDVDWFEDVTPTEISII